MVDKMTRRIEVPDGYGQVQTSGHILQCTLFRDQMEIENKQKLLRSIKGEGFLR